jgi:hypothetical protein
VVASRLDEEGTTGDLVTTLVVEDTGPKGD